MKKMKYFNDKCSYDQWNMLWIEICAFSPQKAYLKFLCNHDLECTLKHESNEKMNATWSWNAWTMNETW